jgi:hypothetical protein
MKSRSINKIRNLRKKSINNRKSKKRTRNQKAGSVGYVLGVGTPTVGGQAVVVPLKSQPIYRNGVMENTGEICGGGKRKRRVSKNKSRKRKYLKKNNKKSKKSLRLKKRNMKKRGGGSDGEASVFTHDLKQRDFGCRQPEWGPKCI